MPEGVVGAGGGHPAAHAVLPEPGETISGKYSVVRRLGEGGMAVVFEAMHLRLRQPIAIKVLRPDVADSHALLARFEREARATALLRSVNAARVIDVDVLPGGLPFMVMELLEGNDLDVEIGNTGAMLVVRAVDIVLQTAAAMQEAHSLGIVHRDLKPANIILDAGGRPHVTDFGLAKMEHLEKAATHGSGTIGTPWYMSPEQVIGDVRGTDARSDIYALGVLLYEGLTGKVPFPGSSVVQVYLGILNGTVTPPSAICLKALDRDKTRRQPTALDFARELRQHLEPTRKAHGA
jgi:serine/threonine-protein kinase